MSKTDVPVNCLIIMHSNSSQSHQSPKETTEEKQQETTERLHTELRNIEIDVLIMQ